MAKKKEETSKVVLERTYVIPLRSETLKVPPYRKAEKAAKAVREFIIRHMKSGEVKLGRYLNMKIWEHGMRNPPGKIKVVASKDDKGKVMVELEGAPKEQPKVNGKKTAKKEEPKSKEEEPEQKIEQVKKEKSEEAKKIEKEEIKELKKGQKEHHAQHAPKVPAQPKQQVALHPPAPQHE